MPAAEPAHYISQTVPCKAHKPWGGSTAEHLTALMTDARSDDPTALKTALNQLMDVPLCALDRRGLGTEGEQWPTCIALSMVTCCLRSTQTMMIPLISPHEAVLCA
jgi:hypothetical protein